MRKIFLDLGTHFGDGLMKHIANYGIDETWEIHTFEANPHTFEEFARVRASTPNPSHKFRWIKWPNVTYHNEAIWTEDGHVEFNCCSAEKSKDLLATSKDFANWMAQQDVDVASGEQICVYHKFDMPTDGASSIIPPSAMNRANVNDVQKTFVFKEEDRVRVPSVDLSRWLMENTDLDDRVLVKMDIEGAEFEVLQRCVEEGSIRHVTEINIEWHDWFRPEKHEHRERLLQEMSRIGVKAGLWV